MSDDNSSQVEQRENATNLNIKYGIECFTEYNQDDFSVLKTSIDEKISENEDWKEDWVDDLLLERFLSTSDSVEEANKKLVAYFEWRCSEAIDDINFDDPVMKEIKAYGVNLVFDDVFDTCGRPIMIVYASKQHRETERAEQVFRSAIYFVELMCRKSKNTELKNFTIVFDLGGFTMSNMDFPFLQRYINCMRDFYPEQIAAALVINYPAIIYPLWKVIKLWMNRNLRSKFVFCGEKEFNDFINIESLPVKLFSS